MFEPFTVAWGIIGKHARAAFDRLPGICKALLNMCLYLFFYNHCVDFVKEGYIMFWR